MRHKPSSIFLVITMALSGIACQSKSNSIFLIPQGYEGDVVVFLDRPYGVAPIYEGNDLVYHIPPDGVLFTQSGKPPQGLNHMTSLVFYVDQNGERTPIPYIEIAELDKANPIDSDAAYIYRAGYGGVVLKGNQTLKNVPNYRPGDTVKTIGFVISSPKNWEAIADSIIHQHDHLYELKPFLTEE